MHQILLVCVCSKADVMNFKSCSVVIATAVTAAGDGIAVSPNINKTPQSQPIVIQNNWDAFQASNGNGRRGLGGTQSLQASPTFA